MNARNINSLRRIFFSLIFLFISYESYSLPADYPPPACVEYSDFILKICPPDPLPDPPVVLISYSIFLNDELVDNLSLSLPYDTVYYTFTENQVIPGLNNFCVKAVYNDWISDPACDLETVVYGYELPFEEDWSSGSFETNLWTPEGNNWEINQDEGDPAPEAVFNGSPGLTNYEQSLESYYIIADSNVLTHTSLEFDYKLESINSTGTENLRLEVWDWDSQVWHYWYSFNNHDGSIDWTHDRRELESYAFGKVIKIRFNAYGTNSSDIAGWAIDNINIDKVCNAPSQLTVEMQYSDKSRLLYWMDPGLLYYGDWWKWGNSINYDAVGTGAAVEFDCGARWLPGQLFGNKMVITAVKFYPNEENADYTVRIWKNDPPELIYEQFVPDPLIGEWNTVMLDTFIIINPSDVVMAGYHVAALSGFPAGVDAGPALDGSGNVMYYEGNWTTLLAVNPGLDYNWNIQALFFVATSNINYFSHYNIYRAEAGSMNYECLGRTASLYSYEDLPPDPNALYCYKLNAVWVSGNDTCVSDFSNEACDTLYLSNNEYKAGTNDIIISPNPVSDILSISSPIKLKKISVFNSIGELVFEKKISGKSSSISVASLPNGLYFIKMESEKGVESRKVIVAR